jgi:alkanesulfonate monooxygenase SsuD/methylene tetrahydromethanopterin reductase-like flavin-dependent oxidoreductase (luciferase family)
MVNPPGSPGRAAPPVWIAGYGPKVLSLAGRIADGVILQFADPDLIEWCLGFVRQGAKEAGRDPSAVEVMAAARFGSRMTWPWRGSGCAGFPRWCQIMWSI